MVILLFLLAPQERERVCVYGVSDDDDKASVVWHSQSGRCVRRLTRVD